MTYSLQVFARTRAQSWVIIHKVANVSEKFILGQCKCFLNKNEFSFIIIVGFNSGHSAHSKCWNEIPTDMKRSLSVNILRRQPKLPRAGCNVIKIYITKQLPVF